MCGISGIFGQDWRPEQLKAMIRRQHHRGPDASGAYISPGGRAGLGHNRLSIIDLSAAGRQPMADRSGNTWIVFNGEIYNYLELKAELHDYPYQSQTDTEVILAAYERWGEKCLDRFIGMFSFMIWDDRQHKLFAARDRFGVKPFNYHLDQHGTLFAASEIKSLHAAGVAATPDASTWATYLSYGAYDHSERTFWQGVASLPPGHYLTWQYGRLTLQPWYDLAERVGDGVDERSPGAVVEEYMSLLNESVRLRFRSDVPVGINLSGGLDSSTLLGLVQAVQGRDSSVKAFTFATGDERYDELPWVERMLAKTAHPLVVCSLKPEDVPGLAASVQTHQDEPFGGLPTLAYARLFERARAEGVIVLLDGQGMDEQWAGYDYYNASANGASASFVQGTKGRAVRPECLVPEFAELAEPFKEPRVFTDSLRNLQYRDTRYTKIPRALRFNDRISMRSSTELREPFLDHRLFELAFRQPAERKIVNGTHKWLLRQMTQSLLPERVVEAPKRPLQTPQREWLRGPLRPWASECLEEAIGAFGQDWVDATAIRKTWHSYCKSEAENSFYVWQWVNLGLLHAELRSSQ
jgi:asparagine synthase (glutamine-hydrolysing)